MRICCVIASLGSGGAERVLLELCSAWQARGDEVTLLTLDDGRADFYAVPTGVKRRPLDLASRSMSASDAVRTNIMRVSVLRGAFREAAPDAIVSFTDRTNVLALLSASGLGIPVVVSERIDPRRHHIGRAWSLLRRMTYPSAAGVVVQTEAVREWAEDVVSPSRVAVIPNPLRPVAAPALPAGARDSRVTAMGRLVPQKGFDVLIRAFATLADEFPDWQLTILGEGPERPALESLTQSLGLTGRVEMQGRTSDPDAFLASTAVFALPSRYEGFPNALLEAMANGCACVSTRCDSGPSDLITDGENGRLVAVDDVMQFAEALGTLMSDANVRSQLGQQARKSVRRFSLDTVVSAWDQVLSAAAPRRRMAA